jgi:hypothetical protein
MSSFMKSLTPDGFTDRLLQDGKVYKAKRVIEPMDVVITDGGRKAAGFRDKRDGKGDCVTRAVAIASGLDYQKVWDDFTAMNAKTRQTKRTAKRARDNADSGVYTNRKAFKDYMIALGFAWVPTMTIGSGCTVHLRKGELPEKGRLVVNVSRHSLAVIDGVVHDIYDPCRDGTRCVYGYWIKK